MQCYSYDEWGNLLNIDAPTDLGKEVANANPFRYVGKFGVQYDNNTKLYFMGWRDYDAKIGRFLVADEYEGEDTNPISFNRYLYAESDPVNNIDPDGHAAKWLKKITKGVKKAAKATYNFAIGDDIKTLKSKNTKWYQKAGAAVSIASNFIPGGGVVSKAAKVAIKGTAKAVTAVKAAKAVTKVAKVVKAPAKKVASVVNIKPKTVPAPSIKSAPSIQSSAPAKVSMNTPAPKSKVSMAPKQDRGKVMTPGEKNACAGGKCSNPSLGECFIAGTKVITDSGNKPIEEIKLGDKVLSKNVETGEQGYKEVKQVFVHKVDTLYHVKIKGMTITNTDEHPYWVVGKGWVEAKDLEKGDQVVLANGEKAAVESVTKEKLGTPVKVYNFEVADWHTYFVADLGVLVHNDCATKGTSKSKWWHTGYVDDLSPTQTILGVKNSSPKGLSTLGSSTRQSAMDAGKAWVGKGGEEMYDKSGNFIGYKSEDKMRAFRLQYKSKEKMWRANFTENEITINGSKTELRNVHVDILD